ncbi:type II secretion protein F [Paenibacillaceae bacterium]|nr:type II secretion protein F [Paenibacillaceae bacterium]
MAAIATILLIVLWLGQLGACMIKGRPARQTGKRRDMQAMIKYGPALLLFDQLQLWNRFGPQLATIHGRLAILRGHGHKSSATKQYIAELLTYAYAALLGGAMLGWLSAESAIFPIGAVLALLLPVAKLRDLRQQVERRRQDILLALPDLLSKLMLLVGAGETVTRALLRCASPAADEERRGPLQLELQKTCNELANGEAFHHALESFSKRCAVQEVSIFTVTLLLNYRRGGERFVLSLRDLSYTLWEKRKAVARARGEEASSKLVFPLVALFFIMMVLVGAPAMLML